MELNQIRYFIVTAQLENMSQAARTIGIAQPTLSKSISSLENELETKLFDRSGKKLILNERGRIFLEGALSTLSELDSMIASTQEQTVEHTLNLGLFCISEKFMACVAQFAINHSDIILNISQLNGSPESIDTNKYDMLLYPYDVQFRKYKGKLAYSEKYYFAVHKDSPLASKKKINISDLYDTKLVFVKYDTKVFDIPYRLYHNYASAHKKHMYTNSYEIERQMIAGGYCAGFVPEGYSKNYMTDKSIVLLPIVESEFKHDIYIGFKREKHLSDGGVRFATFVSKYFEI